MFCNYFQRFNSYKNCIDSNCFQIEAEHNTVAIDKKTALFSASQGKTKPSFFQSL